MWRALSMAILVHFLDNKLMVESCIQADRRGAPKKALETSKRASDNCINSLTTCNLSHSILQVTIWTEWSRSAWRILVTTSWLWIWTQSSSLIASPPRHLKRTRLRGICIRTMKRKSNDSTSAYCNAILRVVITTPWTQILPKALTKRKRSVKRRPPREDSIFLVSTSLACLHRVLSSSRVARQISPSNSWHRKYSVRR